MLCLDKRSRLRPRVFGAVRNLTANSVFSSHHICPFAPSLFVNVAHDDNRSRSRNRRYRKQTSGCLHRRRYVRHADRPASDLRDWEPEFGKEQCARGIIALEHYGNVACLNGLLVRISLGEIFCLEGRALLLVDLWCIVTMLLQNVV